MSYDIGTFKPTHPDATKDGDQDLRVTSFSGPGRNHKWLQLTIGQQLIRLNPAQVFCLCLLCSMRVDGADSEILEITNNKPYDMILAKLIKLGSVDNPRDNNSNFGDSKLEHLGYMISSPTVGKPFYLFPCPENLDGIRTSTVMEIIDHNTFRTHNSIYRWEPVET